MNDSEGDFNLFDILEDSDDEESQMFMTPKKKTTKDIFEQAKLQKSQQRSNRHNRSERSAPSTCTSCSSKASDLSDFFHKSKETKKSFEIVTMDQIMKQVPALIQRVRKERKLDMDDDKIISILRHYNWNFRDIKKITEEVSHEIGLQFNQNLVKKYPDINDSCADKNGNTCSICYCEFNKYDKKMRADSLSCGHQYNGECWTHYLDDKVKSEGKMCVFAKCPQLHCNVVVPHSFFLKHVSKNQMSNYLKAHQDQMIHLSKTILPCIHEN